MDEVGTFRCAVAAVKGQCELLVPLAVAVDIQAQLLGDVVGGGDGEHDIAREVRFGCRLLIADGEQRLVTG